jgi:hypothetical protein
LRYERDSRRPPCAQAWVSPSIRRIIGFRQSSRAVRYLRTLVISALPPQRPVSPTRCRLLADQVSGHHRSLLACKARALPPGRHGGRPTCDIPVYVRQATMTDTESEYQEVCGRRISYNDEEGREILGAFSVEVASRPCSGALNRGEASARPTPSRQAGVRITGTANRQLALRYDFKMLY